MQLLACRAPHIVQVQLGECMKNVVLVDFPEQWPSLLPQLTQNLQSQVCSTAATVAAKSPAVFDNIIKKHS